MTEEVWKRCLRIGELKKRLKRDRNRVLEMMEGWPSKHPGRLESLATCTRRAETSLGADLDCVAVNMDWGLATTSNPGRVVPSLDTTQGPEEVGTRSRHTNVTPDTRSGLEGDGGVKMATRRAKPTPEYKFKNLCSIWSNWR